MALIIDICTISSDVMALSIAPVYTVSHFSRSGGLSTGYFLQRGSALQIKQNISLEYAGLGKQEKQKIQAYILCLKCLGNCGNMGGTATGSLPVKTLHTFLQL